MIGPGYETSEVVKLCIEANQVARAYAESRGLPVYTSNEGPAAPLSLLLASLIEELADLRAKVQALAVVNS